MTTPQKQEPGNDGQQVAHPAVTAAMEIEIMQLRAMVHDQKADLAAVTKERDVYAEMECNICPEDWGFEEYINRLKKTRDDLKAALAQSEAGAAAMKEDVKIIVEQAGYTNCDYDLIGECEARIMSSTAGQSILEELELLRKKNKGLEGSLATVAHWAKEEQLEASQKRVNILEDSLGSLIKEIDENPHKYARHLDTFYAAVAALNHKEQSR